MKRGAILVCLSVLLILLAVTGLVAAPRNERELPHDVRAVWSTHTAHAYGLVGGNKEGGGSIMPPSAFASFDGGLMPYATGSVITPTTTVPEAEEHVALDPNNLNNVVAAISDFALRGGYNTTKYAFSLSGGAAGTWTEAYVPLVNGFPATSDGRTWQANSDPVVAIGRSGNVYIADLYFNASNKANGFYVSVASINTTPTLQFQVSTTRPVLTNLSTSTKLDEDKPWIAVDNSAVNGNVYASWTHFTRSSDMIYFSRSTNQGASWSAPIQVSLSTQNGAVQGSQVAVGPSGEVYVVYEVFYIGGARKQWMTKSTNGGVSFGTPVAITPYFMELSFNSSYRKNSFASLSVSPTNGNVYMVYAAQPNSTLGAEIQFTYSTNGGATWSTPVTINDNTTGQQFMPAVAVDGAGIVHASWFDTRNSTSGTSYYDIYATYSATNGVFSPNQRVTPSLIYADNASFIGDYAGIAAAYSGGTSYVHPVWTSGGFNNGQLQTATLTIP